MPGVLSGMIGTYLITKRRSKVRSFQKKPTYRNLLLAVDYGILSEVKRLLSEGVILRETAMEHSAEHNQLEIFEFLLEQKAPYSDRIIGLPCLAW
uniref:Ankyrin repeat protein n=1 Tax=Pithovirus LCDPAC01 TaxID=2506600 RepID=A0A481YQ47_9VIRU|nr:MAG: ankyrin repeat protein [Pithovirus LCDPAC01]